MSGKGDKNRTTDAERYRKNWASVFYVGEPLHALRWEEHDVPAKLNKDGKGPFISDYNKWMTSKLFEE